MADRARIETTSRKKGRKISPELIEQLLGFAGPGAIKRIAGVPGLSVFLSKSTPSKGRFPASKDLKEALKNIDEQFDRISRPANISRPNTIAGKELRKNVGGRRPPDTELEALALKKQQGQRTAKAEKETRKRVLRKETELSTQEPAGPAARRAARIRTLSRRRGRTAELRDEIIELSKGGLDPKDAKRFRALVEELNKLLELGK